MLKELVAKGGFNLNVTENGQVLPLESQQRVGVSIQAGAQQRWPLSSQYMGGKRDIYHGIANYVPDNGYLPQTLNLRAQAVFQNEAQEVLDKGYKVPQTVRKGAMIDKRIEGITEEYYKKVIYPKQSLTVPERQALEQLRISVGLDSKRGLLPLPMTNDDASRVYETFKAQMDMAEAMRNNVRPQFGNDQPPGDSFPNFNSGAFYSGGGGGGSGFDSISNIDPNESKIAPGSDSWQSYQVDDPSILQEQEMLDRVKNALSTAKKRDQGVTTETKANTDQVFKIAGEILDDVKNQVMKNLFPNQPVIKSEEDVDKAGESILPNTVLGKRTNPEENKSEDSLVIDTKNNGGGGGGGGGPGQRPPTNNNNNNNQSNSKKPKGNKGSSNKKGPGGEGGGG